MYSTNIILKTIFTVIFLAVACFLKNYYLFWLMIFYLLLLTLVDKNIKSLAVLFLGALILLFIWFSNKIMLLSRGILIVDILILYITSITKRDLWKIKYEEGYKSLARRKGLFMKNFKGYLKNREKKKLNKTDYGTIATDELFNKKLDVEANDLYAYSKVRFYGYGSAVTSMYGKWTIYDLIFSLVSILVLVLIYVLWGWLM